jgi:methionine-rich copper-binding protein CopC
MRNAMHQWICVMMLLVPFLLIACGDDSSNFVAAAEGEGVTPIQVAVVSNDFAVGAPRVPFVLFDGPERVADVQTVQVTAFDLSKDPAEAGWQGSATNYSDYTIPYWVIYPELPQAGNWGLVAQIALADGKTVEARFVVEVRTGTEMPGIGEAALPTKNRTLATESDVRKLTSAAEPNPAFYQLTIDEALQTERPTVISFSTPGYCQTAFCAPVLKSAEEVYKNYADAANFIHVEIYKAFNPELVTDDAVLEWRLTSEPWTYVVNEEGQITARFGGPVSPRELYRSSVRVSLFVFRCRLLWLAWGVLAWLSVGYESLSAHAMLFLADPLPGAHLSSPPEEIRLTFTEPVGITSTIELYGQNFRLVSDVQVFVEPEKPEQLVAVVPALQPGTYTVQWLHYSLDGHELRGSHQFAVEENHQLEWPVSIISIGLLALLGMALYRRRQMQG